jgi:CheY-like chemotaxis protein
MKILLVDDDDIINDMHRIVVSMSLPDADIVVFESSENALAYLEGLNGTPEYPELILLDINMPMLDGFGFIDKLVERGLSDHPNSSLYMLSSSLHEKDSSRVENSEVAKGLLPKPLMRSTLIELVANL